MCSRSPCCIVTRGCSRCRFPDSIGEDGIRSLGAESEPPKMPMFQYPVMMWPYMAKGTFQVGIDLGSWDGRLSCPVRGVQVITGVLGGKREAERQRRCDDRSRDPQPWTKGSWQPWEARRDKKHILSESLRKNQALLTPCPWACKTLFRTADLQHCRQ